MNFGDPPAEAEMLRLGARGRRSDRLDGVSHGPGGSVDEPLMTPPEGAVAHPIVGGVGGVGRAGGNDTWTGAHLRDRTQSATGSSSQIPRTYVAGLTPGLPA